MLTEVTSGQFLYLEFFKVKTSLAVFWQEKILWVGIINMLVACTSTRIEDVICFQEALIRFSKLSFPVAHGEFLRLQYEDHMYIHME